MTVCNGLYSRLRQGWSHVATRMQPLSRDGTRMFVLALLIPVIAKIFSCTDLPAFLSGCVHGRRIAARGCSGACTSSGAASAQRQRPSEVVRARIPCSIVLRRSCKRGATIVGASTPSHALLPSVLRRAVGSTQLDLSGLNEDQRAVVTSPFGATLVAAGAGTGKTRTLVYRVAWLLSQGVHPQKIVLLTFTRRAANEMLTRVCDLMGPQGKRVTGGTFHSYAAAMLRRYPEAVNFSRQFTVLDESDAQSAIGMIRGEFLAARDDMSNLPPAPILRKMISRKADGDHTWQQIVQFYPKYRNSDPHIEELANAYTARKREYNQMDFDDLLYWFEELLAKDPCVRERIARDIEHVLVDEYQDTNKRQARIARLLASVHGDIMAVGDEAQSIYAFRGANIGNILGFCDEFNSSHMRRLLINYRSTQQVLNVANEVLTDSAECLAKVLKAHSLRGTRPISVRVDNNAKEAKYVAQRLQEQLKDAAKSPKDFAVLYRNARHADMLEIELTKKGIPYRKVGGLRFTDRAHVRDVLAVLRLVVNPLDELAWFRTLQHFQGVGEKSAHRIVKDVIRERPPRLNTELYSTKKFAKDLRQLETLLLDLDPLQSRPCDMFQRVRNWYTEYLTLKARDADELKLREADLDTLESMFATSVPVQDVLVDFALDPPFGRAQHRNSSEELLTLSTIHSAKGLEWTTVFVLRLNDHEFPSTWALHYAKELEEERRLFYVAVTRCRRYLYLVGREHSPSVLVDRIPSECLRCLTWPPPT